MINMKKNQIRGIAVLAIILVVFLVLSFVIPFAKTAAFWVSFAFGIVAIAVAAAGAYIAFGKGEDVKSKIYGFPIAKIVFMYAGVQVVLSFVFMALSKVAPASVSAVVSIILLAAALIGFIAADTVRDTVEKLDNKQKVNTSAMLSLRDKANALALSCSDTAVKKLVSDVADKLRYSDPVSCDASKPLENEITALLEELATELIDEDKASVEKTCKMIEIKLSERNMICKRSK